MNDNAITRAVVPATVTEDAVAWYAVHTHAQKEDYANRHLRRQGFSTFFPHVSEWVGLSTRHARLKKRAWLVRYLFVKAVPALFWRVNETPGVTTLVHAPGRLPLPVPTNVIRALQERTDPLGEVLRPGPRKRRFQGQIGDRVRFGENNPLFGFVGEIKRVLGAEVVVELEAALLGTSEARVPLTHIAEVLKAG